MIVTHEPDIAQYAKRALEFRDGKMKKDVVIQNRSIAAEILPTLPAIEDEDDLEAMADRATPARPNGSSPTNKKNFRRESCGTVFGAKGRPSMFVPGERSTRREYLRRKFRALRMVLPLADRPHRNRRRPSGCGSYSRLELRACRSALRTGASMRITLATISVVVRFWPSRLSSHWRVWMRPSMYTSMPFFQILLRDLSQLAPQNDAMPFGALLAFAGSVLERFIGRQREIGDGLAAGGVAGFGIAAESAYKNRFVYGHGRSISLKYRQSKPAGRRRDHPWRRRTDTILI